MYCVVSICLSVGVSVCRVKVHRQCAVMASAMSCKWTTLASVGDDVIEDDDGVSIHNSLPSDVRRLIKLADFCE